MTRAKKLYTVLLTSGWLIALVLAAQAGPIISHNIAPR